MTDYKYICIWLFPEYISKTSIHELDFFTEKNGYDSDDITEIRNLNADEAYILPFHYVICIVPSKLKEQL
jgi:hypothetical protein